jgi:chromosome partitioning protein
MTHIIAIANQKGGVAKTTTVVSLGGALVKHGHDVLLVDLDAQGNLSLAMGIDPVNVRGSSAEVLMNAASLLSVSRETGVPGLDLIPSQPEMEFSERFLPMRQGYETILREALRAKLPYSFIILDCPPSMGAVTLNALIAAEILVIPTQPEYFSAHALRSMMNAVRRVRDRFNPRLTYRILLTMHDRRNRIHNQLSDQIRLTFNGGLFETVIDVDTKLRESAVVGLPITYYKTQTRSALQYDSVAQELIQYVQETSSNEFITPSIRTNASSPNPA